MKHNYGLLSPSKNVLWSPVIVVGPSYSHGLNIFENAMRLGLFYE